MPTIDCNGLSSIWQMILSELATKESFKSKFVKRRSKLTGERFVQTLVLGSLERPDASLNDFIKVSADLGVTITAPGLDQRINEEAVVMMHDLLQATVEQCRCVGQGEQTVFRSFQAVYILDSTHISLPDALETVFRGKGGKGPVAGAKLQLSYEYLSGELSALELVDGRHPDQKCRLHCRQAAPGTLHLFDLGYYDQKVFATLDRKGAFFVSRLSPQAALYWEKGDTEGFDLVAFLQSLAEDQHEFEAIIGSRVKQAVRVLVQRVPLEQAAERRRKAKKRRRKAGNTASSRLLALQDWQIFITNVPQHQLDFQQVLLAYRVRWQIELIFKLWKSQARLTRIGNWRPERVLCQLYARLIAVLLFHHLTAPLRFSAHFELSLPKAFLLVQRHALSLIQAVADGWANLPSVFKRLLSDFIRFAPKDKRSKSPSTYQQLCLLNL
jgi:hypothetical protein